MQQPPYNPYAAPIAAQQAYAPQNQGHVAGWEIGEVYSQAWQIFKLHWVPLIFAPMLAYVVLLAVAIGPQILGATLFPDEPMIVMAFSLMGSLLQLVATAFLYVGMARLLVAAARGQEPGFGLMFSGADRFLPMLGVSILTGLAVMIGFLLLIVPGVILALGFMAAIFFCADQNRGPIESLTASWEATRGHKVQLFLLSIVGFFTMFLGIFACGVGVIVAGVLWYLAVAIVYTRLSGTQGSGGSVGGYAEPAMPGGYAAYGAPPGGGYGGGTPPGGGYGGGAPPGGGYGGGAPPGGGYGGGTPPGGGYGGGTPPGGGYGGGTPPGGGYGGGTPPGGGYGGGTPPGGGYGGG